MSSMSQIKPWFSDTLQDTIMGLYFASRQIKSQNLERWIGHLMAFSSIMLSVGVNPNNVFTQDDVMLLKEVMK